VIRISWPLLEFRWRSLQPTKSSAGAQEELLRRDILYAQKSPKTVLRFYTISCFTSSWLHRLSQKDDFEQGLAQCLVEMYACRYCNQATKVIDVYGVVTNARVWQFYKMDIQQQFYESPIYTETHIAEVLGVLQVIFGECVANVGNARKILAQES
jgi:hypothetical protein